MIKIKLLFLIGFFLLTPKVVKAELVINEFSASGSEDWVEVYLKPEDDNVNLGDYIIRDDTNNNKIELNGEISKGGYAVFDFGNKINNSGDNLTLRKIEGDEEKIIDQISFGDKGSLCAPENEQTIGRKPNGTGSFTLLATGTKGEENTTETKNCPTPTPTSTPTDSPTAAPTASSTPSPSPSPKPTKSPTPKPTPTISPTPINSPTPYPTIGELSTPPAILGTTDEIESDKIALPPTAIIMIGGGILLVVISGASLLRSRYNQNTS